MRIKLRANSLYTAKKSNQQAERKPNRTFTTRHYTIVQNIFPQKKQFIWTKLVPTAIKSMTNQMRIKQRANWLHTAENEISMRMILTVLATTRNRRKTDRLRGTTVTSPWCFCCVTHSQPSQPTVVHNRNVPYSSTPLAMQLFLRVCWPPAQSKNPTRCSLHGCLTWILHFPHQQWLALSTMYKFSQG